MYLSWLINKHKSILFLYSRYKQKLNIELKVLFTIGHAINYLGVNLTEDVQNPYTENCRILLKYYFKPLFKKIKWHLDSSQPIFSFLLTNQ